MKKKMQFIVECLTLKDKARPQFRARREDEHLVIIWDSRGEFQSMVCQMSYPTRAAAVEAYKRLTS